MAVDFAKHLRIIDPDVGDELIERRIAAIKDLASRHRKQTSLLSQLNLAQAVVQSFAGIAYPVSVRPQVVSAIRKAAPSFLDEGGVELELSVVGCLAVGAAISTTTGPSEGQMRFLAAAVALGLSFQKPSENPRLESLRAELLTIARSSSESKAIKSRVRQEIPEDITPQNYIAVAKLMSSNAKRDREEVDLLWWVINDWSILSDSRISTSSAVISAIASGIETSGLLVDVAARSHRDLALRNVNGVDESINAQELANQGAALRSRVRASLAGALASVQGHPAVFPVLAIAALDPEASPGSLPQGIDATTTMTVGNWCRRIVDEASLLRQFGHRIELPSLSA